MFDCSESIKLCDADNMMPYSVQFVLPCFILFQLDFNIAVSTTPNLTTPKPYEEEWVRSVSPQLSFLQICLLSFVIYKMIGDLNNLLWQVIMITAAEWLRRCRGHCVPDGVNNVSILIFDSRSLWCVYHRVAIEKVVLGCYILAHFNQYWSIFSRFIEYRNMRSEFVDVKKSILSEEFASIRVI